jgi:uncharacterized protein YbcV (DUF1398 family)
MDGKIAALVERCTEISKGATGKFPEIVGLLAGAGVERYQADLRRGETTYFMPDGASHVTRAEIVVTPFADAFDPAAVAAAIRASQAGAIGYSEFLARIAAAGCVHYTVSLAGRRALYVGRRGDHYTEYFPPQA